MTTNWKHTIEGLKANLSESTSPEAVRAAAQGIVRVLQDFHDKHDDIAKDDLEDIIRALRATGETGSYKLFNGVLSCLYDWADDNRVWIA
jgi:hypothetical protein